MPGIATDPATTTSSADREKPENSGPGASQSHSQSESHLLTPSDINALRHSITHLCDYIFDAQDDWHLLSTYPFAEPTCVKMIRQYLGAPKLLKRLCIRISDKMSSNQFSNNGQISLNLPRVFTYTACIDIFFMSFHSFCFGLLAVLITTTGQRHLIQLAFDNRMKKHNLGGKHDICHVRDNRYFWRQAGEGFDPFSPTAATDDPEKYGDISQWYIYRVGNKYPQTLSNWAMDQSRLCCIDYVPSSDTSQEEILGDKDYERTIGRTIQQLLHNHNQNYWALNQLAILSIVWQLARNGDWSNPGLPKSFQNTIHYVFYFFALFILSIVVNGLVYNSNYGYTLGNAILIVQFLIAVGCSKEFSYAWKACDVELMDCRTEMARLDDKTVNDDSSEPPNVQDLLPSPSFASTLKFWRRVMIFNIRMPNYQYVSGLIGTFSPESIYNPDNEDLIINSMGLYGTLLYFCCYKCYSYESRLQIILKDRLNKWRWRRRPEIVQQDLQQLPITSSEGPGASESESTIQYFSPRVSIGTALLWTQFGQAAILTYAFMIVLGASGGNNILILLFQQIMFIFLMLIQRWFARATLQLENKILICTMTFGLKLTIEILAMVIMWQADITYDPVGHLALLFTILVIDTIRDTIFYHHLDRWRRRFSRWLAKNPCWKSFGCCKPGDQDRALDSPLFDLFNDSKVTKLNQNESSTGVTDKNPQITVLGDSITGAIVPLEKVELGVKKIRKVLRSHAENVVETCFWSIQTATAGLWAGFIVLGAICTEIVFRLCVKEFVPHAAEKQGFYLLASMRDLPTKEEQREIALQQGLRGSKLDNVINGVGYKSALDVDNGSEVVTRLITYGITMVAIWFQHKHTVRWNKERLAEAICIIIDLKIDAEEEVIMKQEQQVMRGQDRKPEANESDTIDTANDRFPEDLRKNFFTQSIFMKGNMKVVECKPQQQNFVSGDKQQMSVVRYKRLTDVMFQKDQESLSDNVNVNDNSTPGFTISSEGLPISGGQRRILDLMGFNVTPRSRGPDLNTNNDNDNMVQIEPSISHGANVSQDHDDTKNNLKRKSLFAMLNTKVQPGPGQDLVGSDLANAGPGAKLKTDSIFKSASDDRISSRRKLGAFLRNALSAEIKTGIRNLVNTNTNTNNNSSKKLNFNSINIMEYSIRLVEEDNQLGELIIDELLNRVWEKYTGIWLCACGLLMTTILIASLIKNITHIVL